MSNKLEDLKEKRLQLKRELERLDDKIESIYSKEAELDRLKLKQKRLDMFFTELFVFNNEVLSTEDDLQHKRLIVLDTIHYLFACDRVDDDTCYWNICCTDKHKINCDFSVVKSNIKSLRLAFVNDVSKAVMEYIENKFVKIEEKEDK